MQNVAKQHYRHIVLFKMYDKVSEDQLKEAVQLLEELGRSSEGIVEWKIEESLDVRKGRILVENALFVTQQSFERFRKSDHHAKARNFMQEIADWWVGDYFENN